VGKPARRPRRDIRCPDCGKGTYPSLSACLWAGAAVTYRDPGRTLYAYPCPKERGWHMTSHWQPPWGADIRFEELAA